MENCYFQDFLAGSEKHTFLYNIGSFLKVRKISLSPHLQSVCIHAEISVVDFLKEC